MKKKLIPVEVYSRVVGYFRPLNQWNPGKRAEFKDRKEFNQKEVIDGIQKSIHVKG